MEFRAIVLGGGSPLFALFPQGKLSRLTCDRSFLFVFSEYQHSIARKGSWRGYCRSAAQE